MSGSVTAVSCLSHGLTGDDVMTRIEVYDNGVLVRVHVVPNANCARVFCEQQESEGLSVLVFTPRSEAERAS